MAYNGGINQCEQGNGYVGNDAGEGYLKDRTVHGVETLE